MNIRMLEMESSIKASGTKRLEKEMALAFNSGQTGQSTKECGSKIKQLVKEE